MSTYTPSAWFRCAAASAGTALMLALGGCGLHLAGERPVPPELSSVYVDMVQPYRVGTPPLETAVQARLTSRGASVKSHVGDAKAVLRLSNLSETRETLSVSSDGQANEYRLVTQITYELIAGGKPVVLPQVQGISRSYSFSVDEVLAKENEQQRLRDYMQDELAALILLRIEAELAHGRPTDVQVVKPPEGEGSTLAPDEMPSAPAVPAAPTAAPPAS